MIKGEDLSTLQPIPRHKGGESRLPWSLEEGGSGTVAGPAARAWNGLEDPRTNRVTALGFAWSAGAWLPSPSCILPVPRSSDTCCAQDLCWMLSGVYGFGLEV